MTEKLYYDDAYTTAFEARVLAVEPIERLSGSGARAGEAVVLDRTLFYPTSGGQPHDTGLLGGRTVVDVDIDGGVIRHRIEGTLGVAIGERIAGEIDAPRRADHRAQHGAQHLLSAAAFRLFDRQTRAVRLSSEISTVDLAGALDGDEVAAIEARVEAIATEAREVRIHYLEGAAIAAFGLRRPPQVEGVVRAIEVVGFDRAPCGGTHPRTTAEVAPVRVLHAERVRGGDTRLHFLAGLRAHEDYRAKDALLREVAAGFSTSWSRVAECIARLEEEKHALARRSAALASELGERLVVQWLAEALRVQGCDLVLRVVENSRPEELLQLARRLRTGGASSALLCAWEGRIHAVASVAAGAPFSARDWIARLMDVLSGRGGGSDELARGSGSRLDAAERALAELRSELDR